MSLLRYAYQEKQNIAAAAQKTRQQSAFNAFLAQRNAEEYALTADATITKTSLGLGNVDNTSDVNKPVSTAQQTALNGKLNTWVAAPATATSTGTAGQVAYDTSYLYVCVSTDVWRRVGIAAW